MRVRKGFVSNSSSTSFILVLPPSEELEDNKIREHFSLREPSGELEIALSKTIRRNDRNYLYEVIKDFYESIDFMESVLDDPSFRSLSDYYLNQMRQMKRVLDLYKYSPFRLRFFEVGWSCSYGGLPYYGGHTEEELKELILNNCFMISNH